MEAANIAHHKKKVTYFFLHCNKNYEKLQQKKTNMLYWQPPFEQKKLENNIQKKKKISILRHVSLLTLPNKMIYLRHATSILPKDEHMVWQVKRFN